MYVAHNTQKDTEIQIELQTLICELAFMFLCVPSVVIDSDVQVDSVIDSDSSLRLLLQAHCTSIVEIAVKFQFWTPYA